EAELLGENFATAPYFRWMTGLAEAGILEKVLGEFGAIILGVMKQLQGFERMENVTGDWLRAYSAPFATPRECLGAIAFPKSIVDGDLGHVPPSPEVAEILKALPALYLHGMRDKVAVAEACIPCFEEAFPQAPVYELETAGHFLTEDEPAAVAALLRAFVEAY
ncbi:MAG: haloalkane dehalogenase, partial [Acidobacteriota bacterium]